MKKLTKRDSERILNHIKKAREIIDSVSSDGTEIQFSDVEIAESILSGIGEIEFIASNTV